MNRSAAEILFLINIGSLIKVTHDGMLVALHSAGNSLHKVLSEISGLHCLKERWSEVR